MDNQEDKPQTGPANVPASPGNINTRLPESKESGQANLDLEGLGQSQNQQCLSGRIFKSQ